MIRQTMGILLDQYRELNHRKLFWIALALSGLVVIAFALIGVKDGNLSVMGWSTAISLQAIGLTPSTLYKLLFLNLGVKIWLAWLTTILALVTTAGMFPDFITSGSIDLALSKPIGRVRLFFTKYFAGLLFVALQISIFTVASFFVLGLRGGAWEPAVFLAIPLVIVFFSYLYSVCVLLGLLTRSTVASLLLTLLFWFVLFSLNTTEVALLGFKEQAQVKVDRLEAQVDRLQSAADEKPQNMLDAAKRAMALTTPQQRAEATQSKLDDANKDLRSLERWHGGFYVAKTVLPKTAETIDLLQRALVDLADLPDFQDGPAPFMPNDLNDEQRQQYEEQFAENQERGQLTLEVLSGRSIAWVVGSSLGFEAVILAFGCLIFVRRDY